MKFFIWLIFMVLSAQSLLAQVGLNKLVTSSCVFNDTLWYINADGFYAVALGENDSFEPEAIMRHDIRDAHTVFESDSYLWLIGYKFLLRYDGRAVSRFDFPIDNIKQVDTFFALSDDTLFFSWTYKNPVFKLDAMVPEKGREQAWTNGTFFDYPMPYKKQQYATRNGDVYSVYRDKVDYQAKGGEIHSIEMKKKSQRITKSWLSPDDKLWVHQPKFGFTIIDKVIKKEIPFSFKDRSVTVDNLFFLENGKVVAVSTESYAVYVEPMNTWYEFPMPFCLNIEQHRNTLFFISQIEFSLKTIN